MVSDRLDQVDNSAEAFRELLNQLESPAVISRACAAGPYVIDAEGKPVFIQYLSEYAIRHAPLYENLPEADLQNIIRTARRCFALNTGNKEQYELDAPEVTLKAPDVLQYAFLTSVGEHLPHHDEFAPGFEIYNLAETLRLIKESLGGADSGFGESVFAPAFKDATAPSSQIDITEAMVYIRNRLRTAISLYEQGQASEFLEILKEPQRAVVIDSITKLRYVDGSVPGANPLDLDAGDCDRALHTAIPLGEHMYILARAGKYVYIVNRDLKGWVHESHVAKINANYDQSLEISEMAVYKGRDVHFYKDSQGEQKSILPGTRVRQMNGKYFVVSKDSEGYAKFIQLSDLDKDSFWDKPPTPQEVWDYFYALTVDWNWATEDCSKVIRDLVAAIWQKKVRRQSGDLLDDIKTPETSSIVSNMDELQNVEPGLYFVGLRYPYIASGETRYRNRHMFMCKVEEFEGKRIHTLVSLAFQNIGDSGEVETVVGLQECTDKSLEYQFKKGRNLLYCKVGELV